LLGWATAILFFGGLAVAVWTALRYVNQEYVLTNRRVIQVEGVLNRNSTDSSLEKINDAVLTQSVFGRMFDFGDLTVLTASEAGIDKMQMLRKPIAFKKAMLDAKHEFEVDMERAGWQPGPPIRDAAPAPTSAGGTSAAAAAASPSPSTPPAPRSDPDEVTRTLASLADLRDRGRSRPRSTSTRRPTCSRASDQDRTQDRRAATIGGIPRRPGADWTSNRSFPPRSSSPSCCSLACRSTSSATPWRPIASATGRRSCSGA
jgi:hypothetical protein